MSDKSKKKEGRRRVGMRHLTLVQQGPSTSLFVSRRKTALQVHKGNKLSKAVAARVRKLAAREAPMSKEHLMYRPIKEALEVCGSSPSLLLPTAHPSSVFSCGFWLPLFLSLSFHRPKDSASTCRLSLPRSGLCRTV